MQVLQAKNGQIQDLSLFRAFPTFDHAPEWDQVFSCLSDWLVLQH